MKYFVISFCNYGSTDLHEFDTKEEALLCVANNSGEDTYCRLLEGNELKFKLTTVAEEIPL
jgi:hypothetical protein